MTEQIEFTDDYYHICPYCNAEWGDTSELFRFPIMKVITECGGCHREFSVEAEHSVLYTSRPIE
jgi:hypothetical protein